MSRYEISNDDFQVTISNYILNRYDDFQMMIYIVNSPLLARNPMITYICILGDASNPPIYYHSYSGRQ